MEADNRFVDHRRSQRRLVFMHASIVHPEQAEHLSCIVHDISADGALLDIAQAMELPSSFWLRFEGESILRLCTVAWRSSYELGVEFGRHIVERRRAVRLANSQTSGAGEEWRKNSPAMITTCQSGN
jgi:PilZ domain